MSEYLQRVKQLQLKSHGTARNGPEAQAPKHYPVAKKLEKLFQNIILDVDDVRQKKETTFGGLKNSFLFASADKQGKKPAVKTEREKQATTKMA